MSLVHIGCVTHDVTRKMEKRNPFVASAAFSVQSLLDKLFPSVALRHAACVNEGLGE